jgi:TrmH family RNA methyltransferase
MGTFPWREWCGEVYISNGRILYPAMCNDVSMQIRSISSRDNPILKTIRLVIAQSKRAPVDLVLAEGIRTVEEATRSKCPIEAVLLGPSFGRNDREKAIVEVCMRRGTEMFRAGESAFRSVSDLATPTGILALVRLAPRTLAGLETTSNSLILVASGVQDPGNLGTLIRTAAAAGATFVCTTAGTVSARNTKSVRSSAGTIFHIPVIERVPPEEFSDYCEKLAIRVYRTSAKEGLPYFKTSFRSPCAVLLGNEGGGILETAWTGRPSLQIPMASGVESLNVAAAGAILLFEARRQREGVRPDEFSSTI